MTPVTARARSGRAIEVVLALLIFMTAGWFHHREPGWNANSRLALTMALVHDGSVRVDRWIAPGAPLETNDVAEFGGHVYSDKIIGTSLLGVPAAAAMHVLEQSAGVGPFSMETRRYVITLFSIGICAALAVVLLMRLFLLWGGGQMGLAGAALAAALTWLGSMLMPYSTLFMSYAPAVLGLLAGLWFYESRDGDQPTAARWAAIGAALSGAVLCEYTAAIAAGLLFLYMVAARPAQAWKAWPAVLAGLIVLAPFFAYTYHIFGRFAIPYEFERMDLFREQMAEGFMGLGRPRLSVAALVTLLPYRGVLIHSPFLVLSLSAAVAALVAARSRQQGRGALSLAIFAAYVIFNSAYYMWWGGWSFSARHISPAVCFAALPAAFFWGTKLFRWSFVSLGFVGAALHLVVVAVDPQPRDLNSFTTLEMLLHPSFSETYTSLFFRHIWPSFLLGDTAPNAGQWLAKLSGPWGVVPLLALWLLGGGAICILGRQSRLSLIDLTTPPKESSLS